MKKITFVSAIMVVIFLIVSCTASKGTAGVWVNEEKAKGKSFSKIFVIVMTADVEARLNVETEIVNAAVSRGIQAVKSIDLLPMDIHNPKMPTKDEVVSKLKENACDAIFIASVLQKDEKVGYTQGGTAYAKAPYYVQGGDFYGYFSDWHPTVSMPSYYTHDKTYYMLSNLYDVASAEIMFSIKSEVFNPSSLASFSRSYVKTLFSKLEEAKLLKK
ncbi:MAG TPA: hypothetical protein VFZ42_03640 [Chitinophagaceae bacterium]